MSVKETAKRYIIFLIGLYLNSFGVSFVTKAALGTSPISSIPYVLSLNFPWTLGQFTIIFNLLLIAIQVGLLGRNFPKRDFLQIIVATLFGYFIDSSMALLGNLGLDPVFYPWKIVSLLIGCIILGFGVYVEVIADVVMLPGEGCVRAICQKFGREFGTTKVIFDVTTMVVASVLSFIFFHELKGVREGTVIAALIVGLISKFFRVHLEKLTYFLFPENKEREQAKAESVVSGHSVITIAREYGAGGHDIGKLVAAKLGLEFFDGGLVHQVAVENGFSEKYIEENEQKLAHNRIYQLYAENNEYVSDQHSALRTLYEAETRTVQEIAASNDCVIVGRLANFAVKDCLSIFIYADRDAEINTVVDRENLSQAAAAQKVDTINRGRREHARIYANKNWADATNYDISINTTGYSNDEVADMIVKVFKGRK